VSKSVMKAAAAQKRSIADTWLGHGTVILFGIALLLAAGHLVRATGVPGSTGNSSTESLLAP
jgi:dipeptide/tripeptide permease